jgi:hypothetical protein
MQHTTMQRGFAVTILALSGACSALGNLSVVVSDTQPTGTALINLNGAPLGNGGTGGTGLYTVDGVTYFVSGSPVGQGFVTGDSPGNYAAPILVPSSTPYGGTYLSTGNTGVSSDLLTFPTAISTFTLLWGSIDAYNTLSFLTGGTTTMAGTSVGSISGGGATTVDTTFVTELGLLGNHLNGSQAASGSAYVTVTSTVPFTQVEFSSSNNSFESLQYTTATIPEPRLYGILGGGLLALVGVVTLRRRKRAATV